MITSAATLNKPSHKMKTLIEGTNYKAIQSAPDWTCVNCESIYTVNGCMRWWYEFFAHI